MTNYIETERLLLRPTEWQDFEPWAASMADPVVQLHLGGVQPKPVAWRTICIMAGSWALMGFGMFSVIEKSSGKWIGRLGPWQPDGWPGTEIGWALTRDAWGKGYATEGATAATDWAFAHLGWTEVIHSIAPENAASQQVAKRLGSRILRQAKLPPPVDREIDVWGQTREEWFARRPA